MSVDYDQQHLNEQLHIGPGNHLNIWLCHADQRSAAEWRTAQNIGEEHHSIALFTFSNCQIKFGRQLMGSHSFRKIDSDNMSLLANDLTNSLIETTGETAMSG